MSIKDAFGESVEQILKYIELDRKNKPAPILPVQTAVKQLISKDIFVYVIIIFLMSVILVGMIKSSDHKYNIATVNSLSLIPGSERKKPLQPLVVNDNSAFIMDSTVPDNMMVPINTTYNKIWRIKNTGKVTWLNRSLLRLTPNTENDCKSAPTISIPNTYPGEMVDIAVSFTTPDIPGSCRVDWKMINTDGTLFFPKMDGLFFQVNVIQLD